MALTMAGSGDEAMAAANGLIDAAEATHNPWALSFALYVYGFAFRDADPAARWMPCAGAWRSPRTAATAVNETHWRPSARLRGRTANPLAALDYVALAIRNYYDSGRHRQLRSPLTSSPSSSTGSDARTGRHHAGFAVIPYAVCHSRDQYRDRPPPRCPRRGDLRIARPQGEDNDHRRDGDYAYDQIDQARAETRNL